MAGHEVWTILRLLQWTTDYLARHGAETPRLDAEVLLAHARQCRRIDLYTAFDQPASDALREQYRNLVQQRAHGAPVAYLVGHREFFSLDFEVTPDVLIPRPETEFVLLALLDRARQAAREEHPWTIVDVGTGSGILAICAARYLPGAHITAIDSQASALAVARRNAARHQVESRIGWLQGDLLLPIPADPAIDFVVSNPPYVSRTEWEGLARGVRDYEPQVALVGGEQGDEIIGRLVEQAAERLVPGGWLILEISPMLAPRVAGWFAGPSGTWGEPEVIRDLARHPRVVQVQKR